jgi:hypothetical protein
MQPFVIMKKLRKGCFGSFGTHYRYFHISYGRNSFDLRPTWVTTSPRELIKLVSQGPPVLSEWKRQVVESPLMLVSVLYVVEYFFLTASSGSWRCAGGLLYVCGVCLLLRGMNCGLYLRCSVGWVAVGLAGCWDAHGVVECARLSQTFLDIFLNFNFY